jgi:dTDP-4-dehydrorhamnose 3,5-epimerase|tara:strand:- start:443 stop:898 length:456 start_codon:yes stop_codon:yes gene_type:complete
MNNEYFKLIDLEKHETKDNRDQHVNGSLTVVWRDWDDIIKDELKMIYVTSVNPGEIKGPHLHTKRNSYFVCIHGEVIFVIQKKSGEYEEIRTNADRPVLIVIPKNVPAAHINVNDGVSRVLTLADLSWKPNNDEMKNISFNDYDWDKWKKN